MRFGILAHSSEGAALCFLEFCRNGFREAQHMHPDVMLDCEANSSMKAESVLVTISVGTSPIRPPVADAFQPCRLPICRSMS